MERKPEIMGIDIFGRIIDELADRHFTGGILPFLNGEALLAPNLIDYLELIREKVPQASIDLFTNASKLNTQTQHKILKRNLLDALTVSFDGGTKDSYESVRGNLSFEEVKHNVHSFISNRDRQSKRKPKIEIAMVVAPENYRTKKELKEEFGDADRVNYSFMFNWGGQLKGRQKNTGYSGKCNFCPRMNQFLTILVTGDVALCCFDYEGSEIVGNIKTSSIEEIWLGETLEAKREHLRKREFDELLLCSDCNYIDYNPITQQMLKIKLLTERNFPHFTRFAENLYKVAMFRKYKL